MKRWILIAFVTVAGVIVLGSCQQPSLTFSSTEIVVSVPYTNVSITAFGTNFYNFTAAGNGTHTIALTGLSSDMGWTLLASNSLSNPVVLAEKDDSFDNSDETGITSTLVSGTRYYLAVDEWDSVAGTFNLEITFP